LNVKVYGVFEEKCGFLQMNRVTFPISFHTEITICIVINFYT